MKDMIGQITKIWSGLSGGQKALFYGVGALVVVGAFAATLVGGGTEWVQVQSGLNADDRAAAIQAMTEQGIDFRVGSGSILVPSGSAQAAVTALGTKGIGASDGRMTMDKLMSGGGITRTDKEREQMALAHQQDHLASVIERFDKVASAVVLISQERRGVSREAQRPAKASVTVTSAGSEVFDPATVDAIVTTVAQGVQGLEPENVSVSDSIGRVLHGGLNGGAGLNRAGMAEAERGRDLATRANSVFATTFGPNKVRVAVVADLDMVADQTTSKVYDQNGRVVLSEKRTSSESTKLKNAKGTVSTASSQVGSNGTGGNTKEETSDTQYGVSVTEKRSVNPGGKIERLTIAVFADESLQDKAQTISETAQASVGFNEARGDTFSLGFLPMAPLPEPVAVAAPGLLQRPETLEYTKYGVTALIGFGLLFFLMKSGSAARKSVRSAIGRLEEERLERQRLMAKDRRRELTDDIVELVDRDTDSVGKLLRNWLYEPAKV